MKTDSKWIIGFIVVSLILIGVGIYKKIRYDQTINLLMSMDPQWISTFRIESYPKGMKIYTKFVAPEPIIRDFFLSLTDVRSYSPNSDDALNRIDVWYLEVADREKKIKIEFHISAHKSDTVVGLLGKFDGVVIPYGAFQSQQLFHWYQKYKDRWLQPTPSPQPTATPR
jgi:hypothetical protein